LRLRVESRERSHPRAQLPVFKALVGWWQGWTREATRHCLKRLAMTPDVSVLLAASRSHHPHHVVARCWLEEALAAAANGAVFTLMPMVIASMLRLATTPKIFQQPTPISDVVAFVDAMLAMPGVELVELGAELPTLRKLCVEKALAGNDWPDVWLAAAVDHQAEHLVGFDSDFRNLLAPTRFTHLKA